LYGDKLIILTTKKYATYGATDAPYKNLENGINITDVDTDKYTLELLPGQESISLLDTVFDDRKKLEDFSSFLPENTIYFIKRLTGHKVKCMFIYNPNWNCKNCASENSHKDKCEMCNTPKPRFRSYLKSGKTKRSKSRSKRSSSRSK
jgi:hypothetical protein